MAFRLRIGSKIRQQASRQERRAGRAGRFLARAGLVLAAATSTLASGCMTSNDELFFWGDEREISYYKDQTTKIDYSDVGQESPAEVSQTDEPRRIGHPRKDDIADLRLNDALKTALLNAEIIRDNAQFLNAGNRLLSNPDFTSSIHDIAIQETNTLFGQGGIQAALAEFDATFTTQMMWGANETPIDTTTTGFTPGEGRRQEFGDFRAQLSKIFANGSQFTLQHNWLYTEDNTNNTGVRPFNSQFTSRGNASADWGLPAAGAEFRTPLLQGSGTRYTRIAGPIARRPTLQSTPTVNQGVLVARIRTDISLADFESAVQQLLRDTEDTYWELYLAYRTYDAESVATRSALQTWREVRANKDVGKVGAADEAQAQDNYFETRARRENALAGLYQTEVRLRRLLGLPVNDQSILRPVDDPLTTQVSPDWNVSLTEALTYRPELRRQKWNIKSLELQHEAAELLVRPRLDFVARYGLNAYGDKLTGGNGGVQPHSAYSTLWNSAFEDWGLGFEFSMPIGFRAATTQAQNIEHRIAKARATLAEQEKEVSYEVAATFQQVAQTYQSAKTNFNRRRAAHRRVAAFEAEYRVGRTTVDMLLRSQISLAQAEIAYYSSLVGYNQAMNELRFRKGTLLMDNSVYLSESLWTEDAYDDALRRAWERSFAFESPNKVTEPGEFVDDCIDCLDTANGHFDYDNAMPMEEALPPTVPSPMDPSKPAPPALDNRSALIPLQPEAGGLGGGYDEFVPEPVSQPSSPVVETLDLEPQSNTRSSIVPAPPTDDDEAALIPAGDPFGPEDFVPPMPLDGRSRTGASFKAPRTGSSSRSQLMSGATFQAAGNKFAEPIEAVEFSADDASSSITNTCTASPIPTFDDDYVADEEIQHAGGFSGASGSLETSPRRSYEPVEQPEAKKPTSSWGRFWNRK